MRMFISMARAYPAQTALMLCALLLAGVAEGLSLSAALPLLEDVIETVTQSGSTLGSHETRLESTTAHLEVTSENLSAAQHRIIDVDLAAEMLDYTQNTITSQLAAYTLSTSLSTHQTLINYLI